MDPLANGNGNARLELLNRISEMIARRSPLPRIFQAIAEAAREMAAAPWGLLAFLPPAEAPRFYGPEAALPLGRPWLQALQEALADERNPRHLLLTVRVPHSTPQELTAVTLPIWRDEGLRGALATFYEYPPENPPLAVLTLLSNQACVALETHETYTSTIWALALMVDRRDPYAHRHSQAVTDLAEALAVALGLPEEEVNLIRYAAILHDVGKIGISEEILFKRGALTPQERAAVEEHPRVGADILKSIPHMQDLIPLILYHHERYDGSGYPNRLRHDDPRLPLGAQILAIADTFDAITTERPYHRGLSITEACQFLRQNAGTLFHPELVEVFVRMIYQRLGLDESTG